MIRIICFNYKENTEYEKPYIIGCPECGHKIAYSTYSPLSCSFCNEELPDASRIRCSVTYRKWWHAAQTLI